MNKFCIYAEITFKAYFYQWIIASELEYCKLKWNGYDLYSINELHTVMYASINVLIHTNLLL